MIKDLWVDRAESILRYYEVDACDGGKRVLLPVHFARRRLEGARRVTVNALKACQFANVPAIKDPDRSRCSRKTRSRPIMAAGTLYATPTRAEPLL